MKTPEKARREIKGTVTTGATRAVLEGAKGEGGAAQEPGGPEHGKCDRVHWR